MEILAAIQKKYQNTLVSATDIRSERRKICEKQSNEKSLKNSLADDLSKADCIFAVEEDNSRIQTLFIEHISSSPLQSLTELLTAQISGAFPKSEALAHQDLSALEGHELCSTHRSRPYRQTQSQILDEAPHQTNTSAFVSTTISDLNVDSVESCISVSNTARATLSPPTPLSSSSPVTVPTLVAMATPPIWYRPSFQDFLVDIESRKFQPVLYHRNDMISTIDFLIETGQGGDPSELIEARNTALARRSGSSIRHWGAY